jgi:protoporphyrinogen oxidase
MPESQPTSVAILGAGLTGLSAAFHLRERGADYRLFERSDRPGGHAITTVDDGYRFDRTGHLLHLRDPSMRDLVLEWLGGDVLSVERRSRVWSHGTYTRYPFQANTFGLPPQVAYECVQGFIDAHFAPAGPPPQNFEEFCLATFGAGISRHFMIPYNTKLWGVPPTEITAAWCSRFVPRPRVEDVVAGALGVQTRELGYNARFLYPRRGIGALPEAMARNERRLALGRAPDAVRASRRELVFGGDVVRYETLISSAPLTTLIDLIEDCPPEIRAARNALRCTHLYYLDVALNGPCEQDLHWVYVPEAAYPFYRVGCYSSFSPAMAPPGKASLYVELADRTAPDLEALLPRVADALVEMHLIRHRDVVRFARVRRLDHAYVIFDHRYYESLEVLFPFLEEHQILSTGRYGGWNYTSMEDALLFGRDAAKRALGVDGARGLTS